jgi:hypothetical protein
MWSGARLKRVNAMNDEQRQFLSLLRQPPARLTVEQTAWVLNCQPGDIAVLVAARLLKPLGNPLPNGTKYFGGTELLQLAGDRAWLARVTTALQQYWLAKNRRRNGHASRFAPGKSGKELRQPAHA